MLERQLDGARRGALADHQVELKILHGRIQEFFHHPVQAVNFVDEQHIPVFEVGQDGGQIARPFNHRPGRGPNIYPHFPGNNMGHRGLAQPRRTVKQQVVEHVTALFGGLNGDAQVLFGTLLADVVIQAAGTQRALKPRFAAALDRIRAVFGRRLQIEHGVSG